MTYSLNEPFDDPYGRWNAFAPWDATEAFNSGGLRGFLTTQTHVDLRSFRQIYNLTPKPQIELDAEIQTLMELGDQTSMETNQGTNVADEFWITSGSPTGISSFTVGKIANRGGWSGLQAVMNGANLDAIFLSGMTKSVDLSSMDDLSIIFPDYNNFSGSSTVQLTSDPIGAFGSGRDSAAVAFSLNASTMPQLLLALADFTSGADPSFSLTGITGIKIHMISAVMPPAGTLTMMAIRGLVSAWEESWLDFDTRVGIICVPVTLDGAPYGGAVAQHFEFVRGDGGHEDPIPADTAINIFFYPGGETSPNDASGVDYNKISVLLRETKDIPDGIGSHLEASLLFNDTTCKFEAKRVDTTGGSPPGVVTDFGDYVTTIGGSLDPAKQYVFSVTVQGTQISAKLYEADLNQEVGNFVWQLPLTLTDASYAYRNGRVGFVASLLSRDSYVSAITVAPTGFAELQTANYNSRTPVDGAQLAAVAASDINLWNSYAAPDLVIDQTKTISGAGSYRTAKALTTNTFIIDDWTQSYLDMAIWVPSGATRDNQPVILLNTALGQERIVLPRLQPAQWNPLHFDLGIFRDLITGAGYSITIQAADNPDQPLGFFWVDNTVVGRRRVAWYIRATKDGPYRPFKDLVNNPSGAVHFNPNERGTQVQLKAVALTEDAWVASFNLFPRYASLGLPVYDEAFDTR